MKIVPKLGSKPVAKKTINKKAPVVEEEDEIEEPSRKIVPVKKIKKAEPPVERRPRQEVMVIDQGTGEIIDHATKDALKSQFGKDSDKIIALLDQSMESGASLLKQKLLQTVVNVIPMLEHQIQKSEGRYGAHSMVMMCNTVREMIVDIEARQDRGMLGQSIVERFVRPSYMDIAVQIRLAFVNIEESARTRMTEEEFKEFRKDVVVSQQKALAEYMTSQYEEVSAGVISSLT